MKATKAYIASLGTTGVLLAASILMLAVVSAVVAFDRWPGGEVSTRVQTLVLDEQPAPISVSTRATAPAGAGTARASTLAAAPGARSAPAQLVADENASGRVPRVSPGDAPAARDQQPPRSAVPAPVDEAVDPIFDAISNPDTTADQVADGAEQATGQVAGGLGQVSPGLGDTVAGAGRSVATTLRDLPLPDHVAPGP